MSFLNPVFGARPVAVSLQQDLKQKVELFGFYLQDQIVLTRNSSLSSARGSIWARNSTSTANRTPGRSPRAGSVRASPRVGLIYRPVEPLTFYASYATSFLPQTANVLNVVSPPPETGEQMEIGTRIDILPTLTLSGSAFGSPATTSPSPIP